MGNLPFPLSQAGVGISVPQTVVYASLVSTLNSNLSSGGGTGNTAALNAVLDAGNVHLVIDRVGLLDTDGLILTSNTTLETLPGCGMFMAAGVNKPILRNKNRTGHAVYGDPPIRPDKNIRIIGGFFNCNGVNQTALEDNNPLAYNPAVAAQWLMGFYFVGCENLHIADVTIHDAHRFSTIFGNINKVTLERIITSHTSVAATPNNDGLHFWGPIEEIRIRDYQNPNGSDDSIGLNPGELPSPTQDHPYTTRGDIGYVDIDGVVCDDQGVRFLSEADIGVLGDVAIHNFDYTAGRSVCVAFQGIGPVNSVLLENWTLRGFGTAINYGCRATKTTIRGVVIPTYSESDEFPGQVLFIDEPQGDVTIDGLTVTRGGARGDSVITLGDGGLVSKLNINNVNASGFTNIVANQGAPTRLALNNIVTDNGQILATGPYYSRVAGIPWRVDLNYQLAAFWPLKEASGNRLDVSGNGHTLTPGAALGTSEDGVAFDGSALLQLEKYIVGTAPAYTLALNCGPAQGATFSMWAKLSNTAGTQYLAHMPTTVGFALYINSGNAHCTAGQGVLGSTDTTLELSTGTPPAVDGNWHHYLVRLNGSTAQFYFDGVLALSVTGTVLNLYRQSGSWVSGSIGGVQDIPSINLQNAIAKGAGVLNRAITDAEIATIFAGGRTLIPPF